MASLEELSICANIMKTKMIAALHIVFLSILLFVKEVAYPEFHFAYNTKIKNAQCLKKKRKKHKFVSIKLFLFHNTHLVQ